MNSTPKSNLSLESIWNQITKKIALGSTILFFIINIAYASTTEGILHSDSITFKGPKKQIEVEFSKLNEKKIELSVKIKNKVTNIPEKFLYGANNIKVESIRLGVLAPNNEPMWKQALDRGFIIVLEFGRPSEHGSEDNPVDVYQVLVLIFRNGQLAESSISTPVGEHKNEWKVKGIDLGFLDPEEQEFEETFKNRIRCRWIE